MIPLKKCNYVTGDNNSVSYALHDIIKFLDDDGFNTLLLCKPTKTSSGSTLRYLHSNKIEFSNINEFTNILHEKGNLFRVDILIFDFWQMSASEIMGYKKIIDQTELNHIIIAKEFHYKTNEDVNEYHIKCEVKDSYQNQYWIEDKISGWKSELSSLSKSYIREKKINQVIDKKEE